MKTDSIVSEVLSIRRQHCEANAAMEKGFETPFTGKVLLSVS